MNKTLTLDYSRYRGVSLVDLLEEQGTLNDTLYFRILEIEDAHVKRSTKIRRIRRALRRYGYELSVKNGSYGIPKRSSD